MCFPDTDDFGRVFRNNAVMSAMGIPQITAIMGMCVAGGAYLPVMCDHILMTEGVDYFWPGRRWCRRRSDRRYRPRNWAGRRCTRRSAARLIFVNRTMRRASSVCARSWTKWATLPPRGSTIKPPEAPAYPHEDIYGIFSRPGEAVRHARSNRAHRRPQQIRGISRGVRQDAALRLRAHRRLGRRHRRQQKKHVTTLTPAPARAASNLAA